MNINELSGAKLDYWVARANGYAAKINGDKALIERVRVGFLDGPVDPSYVIWGTFSPSTNWADAGPVIDRQRYTLYPLDEISRKGASTRRVWIAEAQMNPSFHDMYRAELPLIAVCRLRVAEALAAGVITLEQCG